MPAATTPKPIRGTTGKGPAKRLTPRTLPSPTATPSPDPAVTLQPIEPSRDVASDPVRDWLVRWSDDGTALGYWVADGQGGTWGQLTVLRMTARGDIASGSSLLGPTLAQRSFSMGVSRVAWVAPTDGPSNGELRIRTWDSHGYGGLRIRDTTIQGGVPAF